MDTTTFGFRTTVGGFHKGDVSRYIAQLASDHQTELEAKQTELDALSTENETLKSQLEEQQTQLEELQTQLEAMSAEKQALSDLADAAAQQCLTLEAQLAERPPVSEPAETPDAEAPKVPVPAEAPVLPVSREPEISLEPGSLQAKELAAYRRAEAAERLAYQRAGLLYMEMEAICQDSNSQMAQLDTDTQAAMDAILQQLDLLRQSLSAAHETIHSAAGTLKDISDMVPDPAEGLEVDV